MTFISNLSPWPPLLPAPPYAINWALRSVTPPAFEPITATMLKNHARIEISDDDWSVIPRFLRAARRQLEGDTNRFFVPQTWDLALDAFPARAIPICVPRPPLISVTSIVTINTDGTTATMDPTTYIVDTASEPGRIGVIDNAYWPQNLRSFQPITVRYVAGYIGSARGGSVTGLTQANGIATAITAAPHGLGTGELVTIAGVTNDVTYNGTFEVTVPNANEFTYTVPTTAAATATSTGTITVSDIGVPDEALEAMLMLAGHLYENREASIVSDRRITVQEMPIGYDDIVSTLKVYHVN